MESTAFRIRNFLSKFLEMLIYVGVDIATSKYFYSMILLTINTSESNIRTQHSILIAAHRITSRGRDKFSRGKYDSMFDEYTRRAVYLAMLLYFSHESRIDV